MRIYLLAAACLALASCAHPKTPPPPKAEPIGLDSTPKLDSVVVARPASFLDKVLGRNPKPWHVQPITAHQPINIGRKSSVAMYYGTANVTNAGKKAQVAAGKGATLSNIGKKAGPSVVASDSVQLNAIAGGGNLAAVNGNGNDLEQIHTPPPKSGFPNTLDKIFGGAVAALLVGGAIWFGFPILWPWFVGLFKRRKTEDSV